MPLLIKQQVTLEDKVYHIRENVLVKQGGKLKCVPGTKMVFHPGAIIKVDGAIELKGKKGNLVEISGLDNEPLGEGFIITGKNTSSVTFQFIQFHHLKKVIDFEAGWYRKDVTISYCQISNVVSYGPCLSVANTDNIQYQTPVRFKFNNNAFVDNKASLSFGNVVDRHVIFEITDNLVTGNFGYGAQPEGPITSPIYVLSNQYGSTSTAKVRNNAFFDNYMLDSDQDTIIQELNFGLGGISELSLPGNYFGQGDVNTLLRKIDHYTLNKEAPFLDIEPILTKKPANLPAYIKGVSINGSLVDDLQNQPQITEDSVEFEIVFSQDIDPSSSKASIVYSEFDRENQVVKKSTVPGVVRWIGKKVVKMIVKNPYPKRNHRSFFGFDGFVDQNGFKISSAGLGFNAFNRFVSKNTKKQDAGNGGPAAGEVAMTQNDLNLILNKLDSVMSIQEDNNKNIDQLKATANAKYTTNILQKTFELGVFGGTSFYFGDLTKNDFITLSDVNFSTGLRSGYNLSPHWTPRASLFYGKVNGSDLDDRGAWVRRGYQFESVIAEASAMMEYNFLKFGSSESYRWTPSIALGIGIFYYNPTWIYTDPGSGERYRFNLRDLGTNGQYARTDLDPDAIGGYGATSLCFPIELSVKRITGKKDQWMTMLNLGWRFTRTDYLDDVGGHEIATYEQMTSPAQIAQYELVAQRDGLDPQLVQDAALHFWQPLDIQAEGPRGNASVRDWYFYGGITISRIIPYNRKTRSKNNNSTTTSNIR